MTHTSFPPRPTQQLLAWTAGMEKAETMFFVCFFGGVFGSPRSTLVRCFCSSKRSSTCCVMEAFQVESRLSLFTLSSYLSCWLSPLLLLKVKRWRQSCRNCKMWLRSSRQKLGGCGRNSRHPSLVLLPCPPICAPVTEAPFVSRDQ